MGLARLSSTSMFRALTPPEGCPWARGELAGMGLTRSCAELFELMIVEDWVLVVVCACVELDVGYAVKILKGI